MKILRSEREYDATPIWGGSFDNTPLAGKSLGQSGLIDREVRNVLNGRYYYGAILNRDKVTAAIEAAQKANPVNYSYADLNSSDKSGEETIYAGYGLASFQLNDLDVVAGVRVEHTEVTNTNWIEDGDRSGFGDTDSHYTNVLPSVTAIYRPSENFVYRGAIWTSFSRPEFSNISRGVSVGRAKPRPGETLGEICFRGNVVMKGYLKNEAATHEAFEGGWFHTGDLAVRDASGYIKIKDRSKDVIISGGENISSVEVEDALYHHPAVMLAAVVAEPDAKWGEVPCAFVELKPGQDVGQDELLAFCREHIARYKVPKRVVFGELPKTATGKVQKFVLRQQVKSTSAIE